MGYSHDKVIVDFVKHDKNRNGGHVYAMGNIVYSFGLHFPLMIKTKFGRHIVNADKYSVFTSRHQRIAMQYADYAFPFSAFHGLCAKYDIYSPYDSPSIFFDQLYVIAHIENRHDTINYYTFKPFTKKGHREKKYITCYDYATLTEDEKLEYNENYELRPGATLFKLQDIPDKLFIASMDQNQFYIVELKDNTAQTVNEAFTQLKPPYLQANLGLPYVRQGEWFFIDITRYVDDNPRRCWKTFKAAEPLPNPDNGNNHTPTRLEFLNTLAINQTGVLNGIPASTPVVMGNVRHPQHRMLKLEKDHIYVALMNTAVNSWSAQGKVD